MFDQCFVCGKERRKKKQCLDCGSNYFLNVNTVLGPLLIYNLLAWGLSQNYIGGLFASEVGIYPMVSILLWVMIYVALHKYIAFGIVILGEMATFIFVFINLVSIKKTMGSESVWVDVYYTVMVIGALYLAYSLMTLKGRRKAMQENFNESIAMAESLLGQKFFFESYIKKYEVSEESIETNSKSE